MSASARAQWRREHWTGGVAKAANKEEVDLDSWLSMPPEDRLGAVFDMWDEQLSLKELPSLPMVGVCSVNTPGKATVPPPGVNCPRCRHVAEPADYGGVDERLRRSAARARGRMLDHERRVEPRALVSAESAGGRYTLSAATASDAGRACRL